jgi:DNA-binding NarL/FixJ family response regulator
MHNSRDLQPCTKPDSIGDAGERVPRVRILVADDNTEILDRVSDMLLSDYDVIGKVSDGNLVCERVASHRPDLVVLDISMREYSGLEIARRLREQGFPGAIVFLTVHEDPDYVTAAIGAGACGYVIKSQMFSDLGLAVMVALSRRIFISGPLTHDPGESLGPRRSP